MAWTASGRAYQLRRTDRVNMPPSINKTERKIECVIFDVDGVLIDSSDAHFQSWLRLAADHDVTMTGEHFKSTFGRQNRDIIPTLFDSSLENGAIDIEALSETKERYYREIIGDHVDQLPGAAALVRECYAAGLRCAIGSSGHAKNIAIVLKSLDIEACVSAVVTGQDVTIGKPDPQVFLLAAERSGVQPDRCVVIEDAPAGIEAALAASMIAIGVTTEHAPEQLSRAHLVVDRLDQLSSDRIIALAG